MAHILELPTFNDERGSLTVIENLLPFEIKRLYYIYNSASQRGGHRHKTTTQALICIAGVCKVYVNDNESEREILLDNPTQCLILSPEDWHTMNDFSEGAILLVLASELYDENDYISEKY